MAWTTPRTWVANELVTAAIMNTHVRDNTAFLYGTGLYGRTTGDGAGDWNTASATPANVTSSMNITITCRGNPMQLSFMCTHSSGATTVSPVIGFYADSTLIETANFVMTPARTAFTLQYTGLLSWVYTPSAASHVFSVFLSTSSAGTSAYIGNTALTKPIFWVREQLP